MDLEKEINKKFRLRIPVYTAWLVLVCKILFTGEYSNYLRPEFVFIVILGAITILIFLISACEDGNRHHHVEIGFLHMAILLLPFFYYLNAQGETLGGQAYQKRQTGIPVISSDKPVGSQSGKASFSQESSKENLNDTIEIFSLPPDEVFDVESGELTILDLYDMPEKFLDKSVSIIGMFHKDDPQLMEDFGKNIPIIYRFVITCCVADALPAAILIDTQKYSDFEEGTWVRVQGIFSTIEKDGEKVPVILKPDIKNIDPPEQQYMY